MRRIFRPDEEAPARCSFAACNTPLDRCTPKARSVDIEVGASYLNALVECASLCWHVEIPHVSSDQQNHPDADWPFTAVETCAFSMPPFPPVQNAHSVFAIVDNMPLLTALTVPQSINSPVMQIADVQSALHRGASASRTRRDTRSRAHENFDGACASPQLPNGNDTRRSALRAPGNAWETRTPELKSLSTTRRKRLGLKERWPC